MTVLCKDYNTPNDFIRVVKEAGAYLMINTKFQGYSILIDLTPSQCVFINSPGYASITSVIDENGMLLLFAK